MIVVARWVRFVLHGMGWLLALPLGLVLMAGLQWVEARFFPVVTGVEITAIEQIKGGYRTCGTLTKERSCQFISAALYEVKDGEPQRLVMKVDEGFFGASVGDGYQFWGPFDIPAKTPFTGDTLRFVGMHRCHVLWDQKTLYKEFAVKGIVVRGTCNEQ